MAHYHSASARRAYIELSAGSGANCDDSSCIEIVEDSEPERQSAASTKRIVRMTVNKQNTSANVLQRGNIIAGPSSKRLAIDSDVIVLSSSDDDEPSTKRMRTMLSNFQHKAAPSGKAGSETPPSSSSTSRSSSVSHPAPAKTKRSNLVAGDSWTLTTEELNKIHKCVGCDTKWTARKTPAQKLNHIKSCVRKNNLEGATVRKLVDQQLSMPPPVKGSAATPGPMQQVGNEAPTLLESIANEVDFGKRGRKRHAPAQSLRPLDEAREGILARALDVLGGPGHKSKVSVIATNRPSSPDENFPATQVMPESRLAARGGGTRLLSLAAGGSTTMGRDTQKDDEHLPATQPMPRSRLGAATLHLISDHSPTPKSRTKEPFSHRLPSRNMAPASTPASVHWSVVALSDSGSDQLSDDGALMRQDDAILEGGVDISSAPRSSRMAHKPAEAGSKGRGKSRTSPSHSFFSRTPSPTLDRQSPPRSTNKQLRRSQPKASVSRSKPSPSASPRKASSKKNDKTARSATQEIDFHTMLFHAIKQDAELYLRVLRYEPVHLDVFARLALARGAEKRTLLTQLRAFLDQEGINFHTYDIGAPSKRGRRR